MALFRTLSLTFDKNYQGCQSIVWVSVCYRYTMFFHGIGINNYWYRMFEHLLVW